MASRRILIVEDEAVLRRILTDALSCAGYEVYVAEDGERGVQMFDASQPDLVIADIMLPRMDGFDMVRCMRSRRRDVQFLFLSARGDADDVVEGFKVGGHDYMRKPFAMSELMVRVEALMSRIASSSASDMQFVIGDYNFDSARQILKFGDVNTRLSSREAAILVQLAKNRGRVVGSRGLLLDIWGDDSYYNLRSLNVYISKLRHYLASDSRITILSERGVGYKLCIRE